MKDSLTDNHRIGLNQQDAMIPDSQIPNTTSIYQKMMKMIVLTDLSAFL